MVNKADDITLEVLMRYRQYMTADQLERYSAYFQYKADARPFTVEELAQLEKKRASEDADK